MADQIKIDVIFEPTKVDQSLDGVSQSAKKAGQKASISFSKGFSDSLKNSLTGVRNQIVGTVGAFFAFNSVKNVLVDSTRAALDFEQAITEINTILPVNNKLTADQVKGLRDLSRQYGTSATSQAKSFYQVVSAGIQGTARQTALLSDANKLAIGGLTSTNAAIDILTSTLNAYGQSNITSQEAADSLFTAVRLGKTTVDELASSLGTVLPSARAAGVSFDTVNAAIATLTTNGVATSEAVTRLNGLFNAIARNGEKLGEGMNTAAVRTDGLAKVLQRLEQRTGGSSDKLLELLGRTEAVQAAQILMRNESTQLISALDDMAIKTGASTRAYDEMAKNGVQSFKVLRAEIEQLQIDLGNLIAPLTIDLINAFRDIGKDIKLAFGGPEANSPIDQARLEVAQISTEMDKLRSKQSSLQKELRGGVGLFREFFATRELDETNKKLFDLEQRLILAKSRRDAFSDSNTMQRELETLRSAQGEYDNYLMQQQKDVELKQKQITQNIILQATMQALADKQEQMRQANLTAQQVFIEKTQSDFESLVGFFGLAGDRIGQISKEIGAVVFTSLSNGVGRAFQNVGKALAEGKNGFQAFADGLKNILADVASSIGDVFIKWGIANLVSGNIGLGSAQIAAGGALKVLSGALGASSSGGTGGGTAPSGAINDPITVDDSGINALQETRQAKEQVQLSLNVEGSLVRESELNGYITNLLEEGASEDSNIIPSLKTGFA